MDFQVSRLTRRGALIGGAAALLGGCSTTSIATKWMEPQFSGPPLRRLLVLGISRQAATRRVFEDTVVALLAEQGIAAVASYPSTGADAPVDRDSVAKAVRATGSDGVLVARLVGREVEMRRDTQLEMVPFRSLEPALRHAWVRVYEVREREVKSSSSRPASLDARIGQENGDSGLGDLIADETAEDPSEQLRDKDMVEGIGTLLKALTPREREVIHAIGETSVYRVSDGALLWTALTDTLDPTDVRSATRGFARTAVAALRKDGVLAP